MNDPCVGQLVWFRDRAAFIVQVFGNGACVMLLTDGGQMVDANRHDIKRLSLYEQENVLAVINQTAPAGSVTP